MLPSQVFPGTQPTYWVYVPAQYDSNKSAALRVFNDGQAMIATTRTGANPSIPEISNSRRTSPNLHQTSHCPDRPQSRIAQTVKANGQDEGVLVVKFGSATAHRNRH